MADDSGVIVLNIPAVAGALRDYPQIARPEYQAATEAALLLNVPGVAEYPAEPIGSRYRRTGTLGRRWATATPEFQAMSSGFEGRLGNATEYGPWVQDDDDQAWMHHGRWRTVGTVLKGNKPRIEAVYRAAVKRIEAKITKVTA